MLEKKIFRLSTGNRLIFTLNPPFGYWTVNYERGGVPSHLTGNYNRFNDLYRLCASYLGDKKIEIGEEEPWLDQQVM